MSTSIAIALVALPITTTELEVAVVIYPENGPVCRIIAADMLFTWDPTKLEFIDCNNAGGLPTTLAEIPSGKNGEYFGINEAIPPADGDALFRFYGLLGVVQNITEPTLMTRLRFRPIGQFDGSPVMVVDQLPSPLLPDYVAETEILGIPPGSQYFFDVTGTLTSCSVSNCPGDLNLDKLVDSSDLSLVLSSWNETSSVLISDVLGHWGQQY